MHGIKFRNFMTFYHSPLFRRDVVSKQKSQKLTPLEEMAKINYQEYPTPLIFFKTYAMTAKCNWLFDRGKAKVSSLVIHTFAPVLSFSR